MCGSMTQKKEDFSLDSTDTVVATMDVDQG